MCAYEIIAWVWENSARIQLFSTSLSHARAHTHTYTHVYMYFVSLYNDTAQRARIKYAFRYVARIYIRACMNLQRAACNTGESAQKGFARATPRASRRPWFIRNLPNSRAAKEYIYTTWLGTAVAGRETNIPWNFRSRWRFDKVVCQINKAIQRSEIIYIYIK